MKRFLHDEDQSDASEINISPLIDVVFLLLIFFIVTTVFVEETGIEINKPRASTSEDLEKQAILLGVTSDGRVWQGGREIGMDGVRAVVSALLENDETTPVIVRADATTPTQATLQVFDEAKRAGAQSVSLAAEK